VTGMPRLDLITKTVKRLSVDVPGLTPAWNIVRDFFELCPPHLKPSILGVAVDCVPSQKNRLKVYARTMDASLANVKHFMTLGGMARTPMVMKAIEQITILWRLLFGDLPEDREPDVGEDRLRHMTGGLLFYYELRGGCAHPHPKLYLPVRHLCRDDAQIMQAMVRFYEATGNFEAARRYPSIVQETFTHRTLSSRTGLQTYITIAAKEKGVEATAYLNPECFRRGDVLVDS